MQRIGMIGLDTSHVVAFAGLLNDPAHAHHVPGAKVTVAMPGGSPDLPLSATRVDGLTAKLREEFGVQIVDRPEAVAEACDLLFIESVDGRIHRQQFERTVSYGKPTFIDKPFATTLADAQAMVDLADQHSVPLMSCSALRYAENFRTALADESAGALRGVDAVGPMALEPTQPGYLWYGIHGFEMMVAAMGIGCESVSAQVRSDHDVVVAQWSDGRVATYHGLRNAHSKFAVTLHRERDLQVVPVSAVDTPYYASLLQAIMSSLPRGRSDIPAAEMLEVIRIIEAANASRESGRVVVLQNREAVSLARV